ncbi:nucleotidyltransferase family protein [Pseudothermotoga thermarum]|uniref:DNA polymerase beta domain protein region n=1 Tax=Pseudothermotoga thermarum DSM 5069 TaxID=688269 RepID=F7YTW4_9THEM|nr:nucleotidyltransferase [Pseudothermotoga thermarum]AEH51413.1 DNA polymerase beta domain protein region [Pseudothermotoga thermarum DSM 5069]
MTSLEDIIRILKEHEHEISEKYSVKRIGVFGSFVKGKQSKKSDVDILVEYEQLPGLLKLIELEMYIEELVGRKVDLVEINSFRKELRDRVLKEVVYI